MMSLETYRETRMALLVEHKEAQLTLAIDYALQFNTVQVGDIVEDYLGYILVESIGFSSVDLTPEPLYKGPQCTKEGVLREPRVVRSIPYTNKRG